MTTDQAIAEEPGLRRSLSRPLLLFLVVGDILGAGIYILVGDVAGDVGGVAWLAFLCAFVVAALSASSYAELVTRFPGSAGSALYAQRAFGRPTITFFVGVGVALSSLATAATTARAFAGDYLTVFFDLPVAPVAIGLLVVLLLVNLSGIRTSARANVVMTLIEMGGLAAVIVIGVFALGNGDGDLGRVTDTGSLTLDGLMGATALAFFAFLGFEDAVHLSEEVRDTRRDFPVVLFGAVAITSILYLAVALTAVAVVGPTQLAASDGPLLEVVSRGPLAISSRWFAVVALVAVTNTSLFAMVASSRLLYGMAADGSVPRPLARVSRSTGSPTTASVVVALGAAGMASTGAVSELAGAAVTLLLAVLVVVNVAAIMTRDGAEAAEAYLAPASVAWLGAAGASVLLIHQLWTSSASDLARVGALVGTTVLLWVLGRQRRRELEVPEVG